MDLVGLLISNAGLPNTRDLNEKACHKCISFLEASTKAWVKIGLLVTNNGNLVKCPSLQQLWDKYFGEFQASQVSDFEVRDSEDELDSRHPRGFKCSSI